jgi:hypothetical protein
MYKDRTMKVQSPPYTRPRNQVLWKRLVSVILWGVLFTLAYGQSPLYTSNQNQYFLHGFAQAGIEYLSQDWLANTLDPTPVFSKVIEFNARYLAWPPVFYGYYALLASIYIFSLFGILRQVFPHEDFPIQKRWFYLSVLLLVHSAALRYLVVRIFDPDWAYLLDGGVAGQRLLGSVFQPSTFGVLLLLSIYFYLKGNLLGAVASLVLAPTFHPTYLLSAGVLTLVYMGGLYFERKTLRPPLVLGGAALLAVLPTLILSWTTFTGSDPQITARSREILVNFRIPHHAIPAEWLDGSVLIKAAALLGATFLIRKTRLFHLIFWPLLVATLGTLLQVWTESHVLALLFPWRISTWLVPLSVGVVIFWVLEIFWPWLNRRISAPVLITGSVILAVALAATGFYKTSLDHTEKVNSSDRPMYAFIESYKSPGDVYLIPIDMQDFRLETGAPAYVEFKSIPYKDNDVIEWYRRINAAGNLYRAPTKRVGCRLLSDLYREGVTHAVLPYDHTIKNCSNLEIQYVDLHYQLYKIVEE